MKLSLAGIICLLLIACLGLDELASGQDKPSSNPVVKTNEEKVYDAIADMIFRRDKLMQKFATVFHGELITIGRQDNPITSCAGVLARVVDIKRKFDLRAEFTLHNNNYESGNETVIVKGKYKAKSTRELLKLPHVAKRKDVKLQTWLQQEDYVAAGVDPFDDYLAGVHAFLGPNDAGLIEKHLLRTWDLISVEEGLGGVLTSRWKNVTAKAGTFSIRVDFSPAVEMMPIRVSIDATEPKGFVQETRIEWRRQDGTLVPYRISLSCNNVSKLEEVTETQYRCYWLIGDKVPDKIFEAEDHLAALLDEFKITHTQVVNGEVIHVPHELPEDLYDTPK
jgi:hypothetical protein